VEQVRNSLSKGKYRVYRAKFRLHVTRFGGSRSLEGRDIIREQL
jgi:hypothetical protein